MFHSQILTENCRGMTERKFIEIGVSLFSYLCLFNVPTIVKLKPPFEPSKSSRTLLYIFILFFLLFHLHNYALVKSLTVQLFIKLGTVMLLKASLLWVLNSFELSTSFSFLHQSALC